MDEALKAGQEFRLRMEIPITEMSVDMKARDISADVEDYADKHNRFTVFFLICIIL
jgi:hypothetical protein